MLTAVVSSKQVPCKVSRCDFLSYVLRRVSDEHIPSVHGSYVALSGSCCQRDPAPMCHERAR